MNYQSGDKLKNRYLSNDAFTSLKNKLGGRSITSLGNNRRRNSYRVANQGFDLLEYKSLIYKIFVSILLFFIILYIIPQSRYFMHGFISHKIDNTEYVEQIDDDLSTYNIAPAFLKTDEFVAKQNSNIINDGVYVYDLFTKNIIGITSNNSSSTINIKLFSSAGFKNNFLIEQENILNDVQISTTTDISTSTSTTTETKKEVVKDSNHIYQSYVFEGLGYGQLMTKIPTKTEVKKDSLVYIRTVDGLRPIAQIIDINEDNKSTFTVIGAQLIVSPQNIYKVIIK